MDQTLKQSSVPAIALEDVHVTLPSRAGPVAILRGLDMNVAAGESIAVVGRSGSGKSTLLMIIAGLERATEGRVTVLGADFGALNEDDLARLRAANIGIVFQSFHLVPTMTAIENVALPLEFLDRGRRLRGGAGGACRGRAVASRDAFPRPALRRRAAAGGHRAGAGAAGPLSSSPTSRPAISMSHGRRRHGPALHAQGADRRHAHAHHP